MAAVGLHASLGDDCGCNVCKCACARLCVLVGVWCVCMTLCLTVCCCVCCCLQVTSEVHYRSITEGEAAPVGDVEVLKARERSIREELEVINEESALVERTQALFDS